MNQSKTFKSEVKNINTSSYLKIDTLTKKLNNISVGDVMIIEIIEIIKGGENNEKD